MHCVILRDDDTNALTPVDCLERLYRPFHDRGLPVNLAVIPHVRTDVTMPDGRPEGFLVGKRGGLPPALTIGSNRAEIERRLDQGARLLSEAGFPAPQTFVAPYDKLSRVSLQEVARRFAVLSTGWFELRRLPFSWWPRYALKKMLKRSYWRIGRTLLLTHPG